MEKRYRVKLSKSEQKRLEKFVKTGIAKAREILRARILLQADEAQYRKAKKDAEIAEDLDVCLRTVAATRERFFEGGVERALHDRPRSEQPPKLLGRDEAKLTAIVCSEPPERRDRWTIRLLADKLVELKVVDHIAPETVRKALKKTNLSPGSARSGV